MMTPTCTMARSMGSGTGHIACCCSEDIYVSKIRYGSVSLQLLLSLTYVPTGNMHPGPHTSMHYMVDHDQSGRQQQSAQPDVELTFASRSGYSK